MMLKARFVAPVGSPVIENGAVIFHAGRINAVKPARGLSDESVIDFGEAIIAPGFVNAHTHLELSHLAGRVPPTQDFTDWLFRLVSAATEGDQSEERVRATVADGIAQSLAAGVTTVGDISRFPRWTRNVLAGSKLRSVSFGEVIAIGNRRGLLTERLNEAISSTSAGDRLRIGVSPHSPYTVEPEAMIACANKANELDAHICMHLAETKEEAEFTLTGGGVFAEYLRRLDVWDDDIPAPGCTPIALADRCGLLTRRTILAHANYATEADISRFAATGVSVAYCPRTHDAFGHSPHPFREMLSAGINVCVGTDSLASNPSLSVLEELRFLHRQCPDVCSDTLLMMGTLNGARALGFDSDIGSLEVGMAADIAVVSLSGTSGGDGVRRMLAANGPPLATYVGGVLYQPPS